MANGRRGIILLNLGSPDSTSVTDVRHYLMEFLMDGRVIDYPYLFRLFLVGGVIVPFRAAKSAEAYRTIWSPEGSPLIVNTVNVQRALQAQITEPVVIAMRYGKPSMEQAYATLLEKSPDLEDVLAIPMYPHYAMSSYETAVEHAKKVHARYKYRFALHFVKPFYEEPGYIDSLAGLIGPHLSQPYDHILFSYHGLPERHIRKTDPTRGHCMAQAECCSKDSVAHTRCYRYQVRTTTRLVAEQLRIPVEKFSISFQSRLGKGWLEPFTDVRLEQMPAEGIRRLLVISPAFVSDCLETLEEIAMRGRQSFLAAGGESYTMVPCLNDNPGWVKVLGNWVKEYGKGDKRMIWS
jgi:ferrochelatase